MGILTEDGLGRRAGVGQAVGLAVAIAGALEAEPAVEKVPEGAGHAVLDVALGADDVAGTTLLQRLGPQVGHVAGGTADALWPLLLTRDQPG